MIEMSEMVRLEAGKSNYNIESQLKKKSLVY